MRKISLPIYRCIFLAALCYAGAPAGVAFAFGASDTAPAWPPAGIDWMPLIIALVAGVVLAMMGRIDSARQLVEEKTADLTDRDFQLRSVINNMVDGLIAVDERGIIKIFNPGCERIFGYKAHEIIGKSMGALMPEPHRSRHGDYLSRYRERGTSKIIGITQEFEAVRRDGTVFPVEITVTETRTKGQLLYTATLRDISERKRAEEARRQMEEELRLSKERFQLVVDGTVDGIWDWPDATKDEVYWSPRWKALLGYRDDEITGSKTLFRALLHPDDVAACAQAIQDCLEKDKPFDIEYRLRKKSGEYGWFHGKGVVSRDGSITRMTGSITDITERKFAEHVRDRLITQLTSANEQLEQFAHVASHDLREPLRIVVSFANLLRKEYGERMNEEGNKYLDIMCHTATKMEAMVADLLDCGRIGQEAERLSEIDCRKQLQLVTEALGEAIRSTGTVIESDALPVIVGNPLRFSRLLQNLIGNALKYQRPGQVPVIRVSAEDQGACWRFAVADNGIGIKEQYLESIFAPFKRLHSDHEFSGTGIGLAVCRKIVEGFGGVIWAESVYGQGSTFFFTVLKRTAAPPFSPSI